MSKAYFVDGYHGGIKGHMPLGTGLGHGSDRRHSNGCDEFISEEQTR
ncbi:hypothetical protein SAMN02799624_04279 [Paenibacillus sp. UNC496MF]|nr:hypothetical protein [Paenibacillus sp. UNC496MF]SFJ36643.1 hypothetical protein SAMN02799624_04279 [Paenibacillus sp. UNC496MF]